MKKFLGFLIVFILIFTSNSLIEAEAEATAPFYVLNSSTNRFSYVNNNSGVGYNKLGLTFQFYETPTDDSYTITVEQVDYEGNVLRFLYQKDISGDIQIDDTFTLLYNFSNVIYEDNIAFYRVRYGNAGLWSGVIMQTPYNYFDDLDTNNVQVGDYVYNTAGIPDEDNPDQFTYELNNDKYFILHYNFEPDTDIQGNEVYIKFHNLNSLVINHTISNLQMIYAQYVNFGGDTQKERNGFVLLPLDGTVPPFLDINSGVINESYTPLLASFQEGAYSISLTASNDVFIKNSYANMLVVDEGRVFDLILPTYSYGLGDMIQLVFNKNNSDISEAYTSILARDYSLDEGFNLTNIDSESRSLSINYQISDTALEGDIYTIKWTLMPINAPYPAMNYDYANISVYETYEIAEGTSFDNSINKILDFIGLGGYKGYSLIMFTVMLLMTILLHKLDGGISAIALVNGLILAIFIFMGWIALWVSILIGLIVLLGIIIGLLGGGASE